MAAGGLIEVPKDEKNFKRQVRARMEKTGESYTTARAQLEARVDPGQKIGDLLLLARQVPSRIGPCRVSTTEWVDPHLSKVAADRNTNVAGRRPTPESSKDDRLVRIVSTTWMDLEPDSWRAGLPMAVLPSRWRQEIERRTPDGEVHREVSATTRDGWWAQHDGQATLWPANLRFLRSPDAAWVVDNSWATAPGQLDVRSGRVVAGRSGAVVHLRPEQRHVGRGYGSGSDYDLVIERATGVVLAVTASVDGESYRHAEVTALDLDVVLSDDLTAVPTDAELGRGGPQHFENDAALARAAGFPLFVAAPSAGLGDVQARTLFHPPAGGAIANVMYHLGAEKGRSIQLVFSNDPASPPDDYIWDEVQARDVTVRISDLGEHDARRVAWLELGGTRVTIRAALPGPALVELATTLVPVSAD